MSRVGAVALAVGALAVIGVSGFLAIERLSADDGTETSEASSERLTTVEVVATDIVDRETLEGFLRFRDPATLFAGAVGTVTALPATAEVLGRGDTAYELDGARVTLLFGERPPWRPLDEAAPDGADVAQLEANLAALGFDEDGTLTVDEEFDSTTTAAVESWQESIGREPTGVVGPGDIAYVNGPIRVGAAATAVGAVVAPGTPIYATSARNHEVVVTLDADRQDLMTEGDEVSIVLPDDSETTGIVRHVSRVVITDGEGDQARRVVEVFVDLVDESLAGDLDEAPVDVEVESSRAEGVLAVPVEALLALAEGGYALEVVDQSRSTTLVGVEIGAFADGLVEIIGDVAVGDRVVVPE